MLLFSLPQPSFPHAILFAYNLYIVYDSVAQDTNVKGQQQAYVTKQIVPQLHATCRH